MANATKDDGGFDNTHAMRIAGINAGSVADNAIDVFDAPTLNALDMVVIIFNARFVPGAGGIRQADATDQAFFRKVLHNQVDGLNRDCRQRGTHSLKDGLGIGMRMMMQKIQNRHALRVGAQPFSSKGLNPVMGT